MAARGEFHITKSNYGCLVPKSSDFEHCDACQGSNCAGKAWRATLDHPEILRATDVMAGTIKDAHKVILPDSAHLPNMERPEEFNQAVLQFLSGLE